VVFGRTSGAAAVLAGVLLLSGCASAAAPEVEEVAGRFEDPSGDPGERCDLLHL